MRNYQFGICMMLALIGLSGCASTGNEPGPTRIGNSVSVQATASALGSAQVGDKMALPAGNDLGVAQATVLSEYNAASGRLCRRVQLDNANGTIRIVCQNSEGQWDMPRSLDQQAFRQGPAANRIVVAPRSSPSEVTIVPAIDVTAADSIKTDTPALFVEAEETPVIDPSEVTIIDASVKNTKSQLREVEVGETLWKFSQRVTGNALNWDMIATYNDIDDARTVKSGMVLKVPAHLLRADDH